MSMPSAASNGASRRVAAGSAALLFAGTLGTVANATSVFNFSSVYSYFAANMPGLGGTRSSGISGAAAIAQFSSQQSLTNSHFPTPAGSGNISMVRSGWSGTNFDLSFTQNTSGASSWAGSIKLTFTVTANTSVELSGWLMGRGWGEQDYVFLQNQTDSQDLFRITNRANFIAPVGTVQSFNSGSLSLVTGKTYRLEWLTETTAGVGADQNPLAGFTAFSFGLGAPAPVPGAGLAGLSVLGLAGLARRRRR
jgi:hypothetical protein